MLRQTISHYRVIEKIGAGGMGEVYLAENTKLDRRVALKILPTEVASNQEWRRRFVQEAKATAVLNHPNIAHVYEIGEEDGVHFIAMEYVDGETLRQILSRRKLGMKPALDLAAQVAAGLSAAHKAGIVHRDIKPENIMLREDGLVKVLDFGLAKLVEQTPLNSKAETRIEVQTQAGMVMGTVAYMSPEQAGARQVDARTDIFSLGEVLYEMLTGRQPFTGETISHTIVAILEKDPPPLSQFIKDVPAEIERIIEKALAKNADARYQTANDFLRDLRQLCRRLEFEAEFGASLSGSSKASESETQILKARTRVEEMPLEGAAQNKNSIAVLPFANISADAENEYFCDGLAEELLNALAKIEGLKVAARTSSFSFKGKDTKISDIGEALKVSSVLEGSVRKVGNRVRITAQLVKVSDGYDLWSECYDRQLEDVFDVQDEITLAVVKALKMKLLGEEKAAVLKRYTDNTEAYDLYLKGRYYYNKYTGEGWKKAIEYFEKATQKEPEYAPAHAGISACLGISWYFGLLQASEAVPKWMAAVTRALDIDSNLAEGHLQLGKSLFFYEWNWHEAEREYKRAIELNPNSSEAHQFYGMFLASRERFDEAISEGRLALELDPLSLFANIQAGWIYRIAGRLDDALEQARKMIEIEPNFHGAYWLMGGAYLAKGMHEEAGQAFQKSFDLGSNQIALSELGCTYGLQGNRDEALRVLNQLLEIRKQQYLPAFNIARVYVGLGETDKAFEWLEKALEERDGELVFFDRFVLAGTKEPWGRNFRADPRYQEISRRIGLIWKETR